MSTPSVQEKLRLSGIFTFFSESLFFSEALLLKVSEELPKHRKVLRFGC